MTMRAWGMEIRRISSINAESLFRDVDRVLREAGVDAERVGGRVQQATVAHALQKMMEVDGSWGSFSVSTVRELADLVQVVIPEERMRVYNALHCMKWNAMLPEFRATVCAMVLDDFRSVLTEQL